MTNHVVVIGAGLAGVSSAYMLCKAGYSVTLVEQKHAPAQGSSQQNGAQLSYAYCDALASPSLLRQLPDILLKKDPAFRFGLQIDPDFLIWGLRILANSTPSAFLQNTLNLSQLAMRTAALMAELLQKHDISFDYAENGKMLLYPDKKDAMKSAEMLDQKRRLGLNLEVLSREDAEKTEPALQGYPDSIGAVIYSPQDAVGKPDQFCAQLLTLLKREYGLQTTFNAGVESIDVRAGRARAVQFRDAAPISCERIVIATGHSGHLLPLKDRLYGDMWPVQGYSLTVDSLQHIKVSMTDVKRKLVFAPLGKDKIRIAGLADIGRKAIHFNPERCETLKQSTKASFPQLVTEQSLRTAAVWSGARYVTPSSQPIIRKGSIDGLYLNIGHGTLGWTLSLGAAERLLSLLD